MYYQALLVALLNWKAVPLILPMGEQNFLPIVRTNFPTLVVDSEASNMSAEECRLREENLKLNRQLYWEREQRLKLSRALSESNSSLEMDEER